MNILVTGAASFLGRAVCERFLADGHDVYALIRPDSQNISREYNPDGWHRISLDMKDIDRLPDKIENIDICIHFAWSGIGSRGRADRSIQEKNIEYTVKLASVLPELKCKSFLFAGSQAEYGITLEKVREHRKVGDFDYGYAEESMDCEPVSEYGKAKLSIREKLSDKLDRLNISYIHMRIFSVYGYGDHHTSLADSCIRGLMSGERVELSGCEQLWNYIYIDDCAAAIAALSGISVQRKLKETVNIAGARTALLKNFADEIAECIGRGELSFKSREAGAEGTPYLNPSTEKLKRLTGFEPGISFEEGVKRIEKMYDMRRQAQKPS